MASTSRDCPGFAPDALLHIFKVRHAPSMDFLCMLCITRVHAVCLWGGCDHAVYMLCMLTVLCTCYV